MSTTPASVDNPFYRMAPEWALVPLLVLATMATIIASQALITGAFSLTMQAVHLGYLPRVRIEHTSRREMGQIYIPAVNWTLMVACVVLVVTFQSASSLAAAYGVAVTATMLITTALLYVVMRERWGWSLPVAGGLTALFAIIDLAFFGANALKIPNGVAGAQGSRSIHWSCRLRHAHDLEGGTPHSRCQTRGHIARDRAIHRLHRVPSTATSPGDGRVSVT